MITITITLDEVGRLTVVGPFDQQVLCFGMLEMAKDVVRQVFLASQQKIQPVTVMPILPARPA